MKRYIKARFHTEGGTERMWVLVNKTGMIEKKEAVFGTLANDPVFGKRKFGDKVIIPIEDILEEYCEE